MEEKDIKIAIINEDNIDYIYREEDSIGHNVLLHGYLKENHDLTKIKDVDFNDANSMTLYLREHGKIIFLNNTTYKNNSPGAHGKSGIIVIPDIMSENLKENLRQLNKNLTTYDRLEIWYDFTSHMECKMIFTQTKEQVTTIVDYLLSKYENIEIKEESKSQKTK